jgi:hypothetical protein
MRSPLSVACTAPASSACSEAGVQGVPAPVTETPAEDELLKLLADRARKGNVAAIRPLLLREEQKDPRTARCWLTSQ